MTQEWEASESLKAEMAVAFFPAVLLLEAGADIHMPWWAMLIVAAGVTAVVPRQLYALRHDGHAVLMTLVFGTGYWLVWEVAAWLGENGAEWLHRGWRWWLVAVMISAGFRAWDLRSAPPA